MSSVMPVGWEMPGSGIEFDENDTMFSKPRVNSLIMPKTCVWTLKRTEGTVFLFFEDPTNNSWNDEHFSRWTKESNTSRFVLSKPTMRTHVVSVFSWKFLPNNLGLGSIVFYGSVKGNKFQIYCGDNIKNTKTNPSHQTWDVLNGSNLPPDIQVSSDMFSAIELENANTKLSEAKNALKTFCLKVVDEKQNWILKVGFVDYMEPHISKLSNAVEKTAYILEVSEKYSVLDGETFLLSPEKEWVFLDSDGDMGASEYTGKGASLVLEDEIDNDIDCFQNHPNFKTPISTQYPPLGEPYLKNGELHTTL